MTKDKANYLATSGPVLAGRIDVARKILNTFLVLPFLFDMIVKDRHFAAVLENRVKRNFAYLVCRLFEKTLWFWPRITDARIWAEGGTGKPRRPENFISLDVSANVLCEAVERYAHTKDAVVLDLGCNVGRHLDQLHRRGFTNLTGVDAMAAAIEQMKVRFPEAAGAVQLRHDLFQRFLRRQPDRSFDLIYSHGATIELVHPSFDIVGHMCRATRDHVLLILNETHRVVYPRFWTYEFARNGFFLHEARRPLGKIPPEDSSDTPSLLVYTRYL